MSGLAVILRQAAAEDVDRAVDHYLGEAGPGVARAFVEALEHALSRIGEHPEAGSPRYATELDVPGLRFWALARFPYLVFYVRHAARIDVWRMLHAQQDIPAWMQPGAAGARGPDEVREPAPSLHEEVW